MVKTQIDNDNLPGFVHKYVNNNLRHLLPPDLRENINDWDVSEVTDMSGLFRNMSSFNEGLNRWVVDQVKDMSFMFANCTAFNKPLDEWIVQSVVNMNHMFLNCTALNQDFSNWGDDFGSTFTETGIIVNIDNIFQGCDAMARRPASERLAGNQWMPEDEVDPNQIHRAMALVDNNKLFSFFGKYLSQEIMVTDIDTIDFAIYIYDHICNMIMNIRNFTRDTSNQFKNMLDILMVERLNELEYSTFSPVLLRSVFYALEYAKIQPVKFQQAYITSFLGECFTAYDNDGGVTNPDNISCAQGIIERLISSLAEACSMVQDANMDESKMREYRMLGSIISPPNIDNYASVWFRSIGKNIPVAERRQSFIDFISQNFEESMLLDDDTKKRIEEYADNIGHRGLGFTDEYFDGGRRKITRKKKLRQTTRKRISRKRNTKKKKKITGKKRRNKIRTRKK